MLFRKSFAAAAAAWGLAAACISIVDPPAPAVTAPQAHAPDGSPSPDPADPTAPANAGATTMTGAPPAQVDTQARDPGEVLFEQDVAPILAASCAATPCHGASGGGHHWAASTEPTMMYVAVSSDPDLVGSFDRTAPIVSKIAAGHNATYTAAQETAVVAWLDAEHSFRQSHGMTSPLTALLEKWSGCMDLATFQSDAVATAFAHQRSSVGPCMQCHVNGEANFIASEDVARMFAVVSSRPAYMQTFFSFDVATGKIATNDTLFASVAAGKPPFTQHPSFVYTSSTANLALQRFFADTVTKARTSSCGPSKLSLH